jgi:GNAT superfamily N-acetyltransferase
VSDQQTYRRPSVWLDPGVTQQLPEIHSLNEWEIDAPLRERAESLLRASFPGYPARSYFKLPPHLRYFACGGDEVVGHMGVEHRVIRVGDVVFDIVGVVDLCVSERLRSRGIAAALLEEVTTYAQRCDADFILLFADRHDLYLRAGWTLVDNLCTWLKIDGHQTLGIAMGESLADCMMVKPVGDRDWPSGDVDMLGHVF